MDENPYKAPQEQGTKPLSPVERRRQLWGLITLGLILSQLVALFCVVMQWIGGMTFANYVICVWAVMGAVSLWADHRTLRWWAVLFWLSAAAFAFALYTL